MTKKKEIELARKFFDLIFRKVENGEDVIYDFIDPECRCKTLCDKLNNETIKEVLELGFKQKYGEEWHGEGEQDNVDSLYDAKAVGNAVAMREALEKCMELGKKIDESLGNDESTVWNCRYERSFANSIVEIAKAALSKPRRQYDVGTTEEQYKRFKKFCFDNMGDGINEDRCSKCPIGKTKSSCRFDWAQMPYESQNGKG